MSIDFSNQSQVFPQVPSDQNPYIYAESIFTNGSPFNSAVIANVYVYVTVYSLGILIIILTFILNFAYYLRTSRPVHLYRCVSRPEGNYYTVDNQTFVPLTQLVFWILLLVAMITNLLVRHNPSLLYHILIRNQIPLIFMYLQAHGFVCGMLVGAIVTWSEVTGKHNNSKILPHLFNAIQIHLALLIVIVNLIFMIKADNANKNLIHTSMQLTIQLSNAAPTWTAKSPLDPNVSKSIYNSMRNIRTYGIDVKNNLRDVWISWIFTCVIPLTIFIISSAVILIIIRFHINNVTASGICLSTGNTQVEQSTSASQAESLPNISRTTKTLSNLQRIVRLTRNSSRNSHQAQIKSVKLLRELEKTLLLRITVVTIPAIAYSIWIRGLFTDFSTNQLGELANFGVVPTYVFPWLSIVSGSAIILWWFYVAFRDWRTCRNGNNRLNKPQKFTAPSARTTGKEESSQNQMQIPFGDDTYNFEDDTNTTSSDHVHGMKMPS